MIRLMSGVTRKHRIRNKLRCFGCIIRIEESEAVKMVLEMKVEGSGGRGRSKRDG